LSTPDPAVIREAVQQRLTEARFAHSVSVAATAVELARAYKTDEIDAELAGLLHDWDKDLPLNELIHKAEEFGIAASDNPESLLHAHTAACSLPAVFPELSPSILQAIDRHTLADADMSQLDMIIYISDMLEPLRDFTDDDTIQRVFELRKQVGNAPLEAIFMSTLQMTLAYLIKKSRQIHPGSITAMEDILRRSTETKTEAYTLATETLRQAYDLLNSNNELEKPVKTSREIALLAAVAADEKKATDIVIQEVGQTLVICDYFVIATGAMNRQVDAICEAIEEKLRVEAGIKPIGREGLDELTWVLLDYGDVVVHVLQPEIRDFYRLEALWSDAPFVDLKEAGIVEPEFSQRIAKLMAGQIDVDESTAVGDSEAAEGSEVDLVNQIL